MLLSSFFTLSHYLFTHVKCKKDYSSQLLLHQQQTSTKHKTSLKSVKLHQCSYLKMEKVHQYSHLKNNNLIILHESSMLSHKLKTPLHSESLLLERNIFPMCFTIPLESLPDLRHLLVQNIASSSFKVLCNKMSLHKALQLKLKKKVSANSKMSDCEKRVHSL